MVIAVLILGLVVVGLAVAVLVVERKRRRAVAAGMVADQRTVTLKAELASTRDELADARQDLSRREGELLTARAEYEVARQQLAAEQQRVGSLQVDLEVRQLEIDRVTTELRRAVTGHDAASLWQLEMMRSERTWRYNVAPGLDSASPLDDPDADQLHVAVDIEASAVREQSGTAVEVEWTMTRRIDPGPSLAVLRQVQEQLARFAKRSDRVTVRVVDGGDHVTTEVLATGDPEGTGLEPVVLHVACD